VTSVERNTSNITGVGGVGNGSPTALKLMAFDAVNARAVMHSSLRSDDVQRAIDKTRLVLHQLRC